MAHNRSGRKLGRKTAHRKALMANLATALITHKKIKTTDAKAKELRMFIEPLITFAKRGDLHARRQVLKKIPHKSVVRELFEAAMEDIPGSLSLVFGITIVHPCL